jgi:hypothetical protein
MRLSVAPVEMTATGCCAQNHNIFHFLYGICEITLADDAWAAGTWGAGCFGCGGAGEGLRNFEEGHA